MALIYQKGSILLISSVPDENGVNPKTRPVLVVRDYDDADVYVMGVAVTTTFPRCLPDTLVPLPFRQGGQCKTGLWENSVANCRWWVSALVQDVIEKRGYIATDLLNIILQKVTPPPSPSSTTAKPIK